MVSCLVYMVIASCHFATCMMAKRSHSATPTSDLSGSSSSGSSSESKQHAGHREGFYPSLLVDFPFQLPVGDRDGTVGGRVVSLLCSLCKKHKTDQQNPAGTWTTKPCTYIRRDTVEQYS